MSATEHFDAGDAALCALGALEEGRRRAVEDHAGQCEVCARLLADAERDVAALASAQPQFAAPAAAEAIPRPATRRSPPQAAWAWPLAAAFALAIVSTGYLWQQNRSLESAMRRDDQAVARLNQGAFRTADFRGMPGGAQARVMYAPDGTWYVVLVEGATRALQLAWMHDGTATMLGDVRPRGRLAMLYLAKSHRMERLALMDGRTVVAEAELGY